MVGFASPCKFMHKSIMIDNRSRRQRALAELLRRQRLTRQGELVSELRGLGYAVTQATVSRDLDQLGAIKIRQSGETRYALPEDINALSPSRTRLRELFSEWVRAVTPAGSLVIVKTPPGSAHLIGVALDSAALPTIAGTISGDDTLFIATSSNLAAERLATEWKGWIGS